MIREAVEADIPALVEMGRAFHAMSPHRQSASYDGDGIANVLRFMIEADHAVVLTNEAGVIGGVLAPLFIDPAKIILEESFWWATASGFGLLDAFEAWGVARRADLLMMCTLHNERSAAMDRIMRSRGYSPIEVRYMKVLTP